MYRLEHAANLLRLLHPKRHQMLPGCPRACKTFSSVQLSPAQSRIIFHFSTATPKFAEGVSGRKRYPIQNLIDPVSEILRL